MSPREKDERENKNFPNVQETRFTDEDDRYLEGDGEKPYLTERSVENPDHIGNPQKTKDESKKLFDR
jgi:hypothetical protein